MRPKNQRAYFSRNSPVKKYIWLLVILLGIILIFQKVNWLPSFSDLFRSKRVTIDDTPVLIKEINNLSQLVTITAFDEVVMDSVKKLKSISIFLPPPTFKIVLVGKGKVMAGVDLKKVKSEDIFVYNDSVRLVLPPVEILYSILNPSDFETFDETGNWTADEVNQIKMRMRDKMISRAIDQDILQKAANRCKLLMENFFKNAGFNKTHITVRN